MGSSVRRRKQYARKRTRRFGTGREQQPPAAAENNVNNPQPVTADAANTDVPPAPPVVKDVSKEFYFLMNIDIWMKIIEIMNKPCIGCCNRHDAERSLKIDASKKQGFAQKLELLRSCGNTQKFYSSKKIDPDKPTRFYFDVNVRAVICFRELGLGHSSLENFARHMNMPPALRLVTKTF